MEVLVALAILAMSLGILLGVFSQALDRVREGQIEASAYNLAKSLLLRAETADPSDFKETQGVSGPDLRWRIHVQDYGSEQDRTNWPQRAVQVSTVVSWEDHGRDRFVTLSTMRLLPKNTKNE
jgi:general secretion pathway protein I